VIAVNNKADGQTKTLKEMYSDKYVW